MLRRITATLSTTKIYYSANRHLPRQVVSGRGCEERAWGPHHKGMLVAGKRKQTRQQTTVRLKKVQRSAPVEPRSHEQSYNAKCLLMLQLLQASYSSCKVLYCSRVSKSRIGCIPQTYLCRFWETCGTTLVKVWHKVQTVLDYSICKAHFINFTTITH
jgi:hypothetical protein